MLKKMRPIVAVPQTPSTGGKVALQVHLRSIGPPVALGAEGCRRSHPEARVCIWPLQSSPRSSSPSDRVTVPCQ